MRAEEEAGFAQQIADQNDLASSSRRMRRHGAGSAANHDPAGYGAHTSGFGDKKASADDAQQEAEPSKAEARRLRQRANRAAASARRLAEAECLSKEQFLRETAAGFVDRGLPLEPMPSQRAKAQKAKPAKEPGAENKIAEDLLIGLWGAKLKHAGQSRAFFQSQLQHSLCLKVKVGSCQNRCCPSIIPAPTDFDQQLVEVQRLSLFCS